MAKNAASKNVAKKKTGKPKIVRHGLGKATAKRKTAAARKTMAKKKTTAPKPSASKKTQSGKLIPPKPKPAKAKELVPEPVLGTRSQHVDFLTFKVEQVRKFYGDVLGFKTEQIGAHLNYLYVHTTPRSSIGFMPPNPQMTGEQPPPQEATLYFVVEDVDRVYETLNSKGLAFIMGPPKEMPWGHRVIMTTDPEGRHIMLGSEKKKA